MDQRVFLKKHGLKAMSMSIFKAMSMSIFTLTTRN